MSEAKIVEMKLTKLDTAPLAEALNEFHAKIVEGSATYIADALTLALAESLLPEWVRVLANPPMRVDPMGEERQSRGFANPDQLSH